MKRAVFGIDIAPLQDNLRRYPRLFGKKLLNSGIKQHYNI